MQEQNKIISGGSERLICRRNRTENASKAWLQFILSTFWISLKQIRILRIEWTWKWPRRNVGVCSAHLLCNNLFVFPVTIRLSLVIYRKNLVYNSNSSRTMIVLSKRSKVPLKCTFLYPKKCNTLNFDVSFEYFTPNDRRFGHFFKWKLKPKIIF